MVIGECMISLLEELLLTPNDVSSFRSVSELTVRVLSSSLSLKTFIILT